MKNNQMPVIAAVPNYNMEGPLSNLLPQLAEQEYHDIYVLDDASTDGSRDVVSDFDKSVHFIAGDQNRGAGANRNRILGNLGHQAIIHFIDADMAMNSKGNVEIARELMEPENSGFVGGLVSTENGKQHPFNYGPRQCLRSAIAANLQTYVCSLVTSQPEKAQRLRERFDSLLSELPDIQSTPSARPTFWTAESNMLIRSDIFESFKGFNPSLRDHEIQDLAIRMHAQGLNRRFDPSLAATHKQAQVRHGNRNLQMVKAELQIARLHGYRNWIAPDGTLKPSL